jgi:hypothetical protein
MGVVGIARTQDLGQRKTILPVKDKERMIHLFFIVAMVETQLLLSVSRVISAV